MSARQLERAMSLLDLASDESRDEPA